MIELRLMNGKEVQVDISDAIDALVTMCRDQENVKHPTALLIARTQMLRGEPGVVTMMRKTLREWGVDGNGQAESCV